MESEKGNEVNVWTRLRFVDTMHFMSSSLEKLVKNLERFPHTSKYFSADQLDLVLRKGVYPYEYVDCLDKLIKTKLPSKDRFVSTLSGTTISDKDYELRKMSGILFGAKHSQTTRSSTVSRTSFFLLMSLKISSTFKLDPAHYITAPSLALDAMLKMTEVELELLTDPDFFEKGVRGGVSTITKRYAKANNRYMGDEYDPNKPSIYIPYLDANNLYGWAMSQPLPCSDFRWLSEEELE